MAVLRDRRSVLALNFLQHFPQSIRESLMADPDFRSFYGLKEYVQLSLGEVPVNRSELFDCIREALADSSAQPTLKDEAGHEWRLELVEIDNQRQVRLSHGESRLLLPDFPALSPDQADRIKRFEREADDVNLPEETTRAWREILTSRALADDEMWALQEEIKETPIRVADAIALAVNTGKGSISTLIPRSERYFERLVGEYRHGQSIADYLQVGVREHIDQLVSWRAYDGFMLSLLLSSHSSISSIIATDHLDEKELIQAYEWLQNEGDRISQIGAVEIGLSILDKRPKIEPYLESIIKTIRDDDPDGQNQFQLMSSLIILVEGELARTKALRGKPVFWRRLASIAHAALIERCIIKSNIDIASFTRRARQARGPLFYIQTIVDLRQEPRWLPEYVLPSQLKAELIGRIVSTAKQNDTKIHTTAMRELIFGEGPESIGRFLKDLSLSLPGPLEGGLESQLEPPAEILRSIEEQLSAKVLPLVWVALGYELLYVVACTRHITSNP